MVLTASLLLAGCASSTQAPQSQVSPVAPPASEAVRLAAGPYPHAYTHIAQAYLHLGPYATVSKPQLSADPAGWRVVVSIFRGRGGGGYTMQNPILGTYHNIALYIRAGAVVGMKRLPSREGWYP